MVVSVTAARRAELTAYVERAAAAGHQVTVLSGGRRSWDPLPGTVRLLDLELLLAGRPWHRLLTVGGRLWSRRRWHATLERVLRRTAGAVRGRPRAALAARARARRWRANAAERAAAARPALVDRWLAGATWGELRPWLLWRAVRPEQLRFPHGGEVVWGERAGWPIAWQLSRGQPEGLPPVRVLDAQDAATDGAACRPAPPPK